MFNIIIRRLPRKSIFLTSCLIGFICLLIIGQNNITQYGNITRAPISAPAILTISINGNNDFSGKINGGSGTLIDPYIIANRIISASSADGISIQNTNVYVIIQNCSVTSGGGSYNGIYLQNTTNVIIRNNTLTDDLTESICILQIPI